jgi:transcriptional regulator of acetoin/glycerol metabolism
MTWATFLRVIEVEVGPEARARIEARALRMLAGVRITIPAPTTRTPPTRDAIRACLGRHHWRVAEAAAELGVAESTIYRAMGRERLARVTMDRACRRSDVWD